MTPLLSPGHAAQLLDGVVFERVFERVDISGLRSLETKLTREVERLDGHTETEARAMARELVRRALHRLADDDRWHRRVWVPPDELPSCGSLDHGRSAHER